jgi:hypothetical protein
MEEKEPRKIKGIIRIERGFGDFRKKARQKPKEPAIKGIRNMLKVFKTLTSSCLIKSLSLSSG